MPGGKPGDHPYTDIVIHGWSDEVGQEMSDLVRALAQTSGFAPFRDEVSDVLESCSQYWGSNPTDQVKLDAMDRLIEIKRALESQLSK
jgi:nitrate reductase assembly molybdenum cofactor insertion protein NarJ